MSGFGVLMRRELSLAWGKGGGALLALTFYVATSVLLILSIGGGQGAARKEIALGSAWLALALASLLSLERLFERDFEDGGLDLLALGPIPLEAACLIKCLAQWLAQGLPLALVSAVAAADAKLAPLVLLIGLVGGLAFSFMGGIGAALAIGSRRGGVLIAVIVLPLFTPPVIFGIGAMDAFAGGLEWRAGLIMLAAYAAAAVTLGPIAMAAAVRNALS